MDGADPQLGPIPLTLLSIVGMFVRFKNRYINLNENGTPKRPQMTIGTGPADIKVV